MKSWTKCFKPQNAKILKNGPFPNAPIFLLKISESALKEPGITTLDMLMISAVAKSMFILPTVFKNLQAVTVMLIVAFLTRITCLFLCAFIVCCLNAVSTRKISQSVARRLRFLRKISRCLCTANLKTA